MCTLFRAILSESVDADTGNMDSVQVQMTINDGYFLVILSLTVNDCPTASAIMRYDSFLDALESFLEVSE